MKKAALLALLVSLTGCAGIRFDGREAKGLVYYDPKPYLFVTTNKDCVTTATVVTLPEKRRAMEFKSGYGSSALSAGLANGMVTTVGQTVDTKIPETITAVASLATAAKGFMPAAEGLETKNVRKMGCKPTSALYAIANGAPDLSHPLGLPAPELVAIEE
jgi:hypothetical protein